jgi:hypothetical protein
MLNGAKDPMKALQQLMDEKAVLEKKMEQVSQFMADHGVEMNKNEIAKRLRSEGLAIGNDGLKVILDSLVNRRCLSIKQVGQKNLYRYEMAYLVNDLKSLPVDNL